jgi:hypothetical protein
MPNISGRHMVPSAPAVHASPTDAACVTSQRLRCVQADEKVFPDAFGIGKTSIRLKQNAEEKIRAFFLPFTMQAHTCTVTFTDKAQGSFCYELAGSVLLPSMLAEHQLTMDINNPAPLFVPLTTQNAQLEAARKVFIDSHPGAKDKEQLALVKAKHRGGGQLGAAAVPTHPGECTH